MEIHNKKKLLLLKITHTSFVTLLLLKQQKMTTTDNTNYFVDCKTDSLNQQESFSKRKNKNENLYYPMKNITFTKPFRGRCVIFNYEDFTKHQNKKLTNRTGTQKDVVAITKTFSELGYDVFEHRDLALTKTKQCLNEESKVDHTEYDSFVLFFLTHGDDGDSKIMRFLCFIFSNF